MTKLPSLSNGVIATFLFVFVLVAYLQFPIRETLGDPVWYLPTAFSLVNEGNADLTEYELLINEFHPTYDYTYIEIDGKPYNLFTIGPSLIAVPFVAVFQQASNTLLSIDLYALSQQQLLIGMDLFIGSFVVAAAVALIYLTARFYLPNHFALLV